MPRSPLAKRNRWHGHSPRPGRRLLRKIVRGICSVCPLRLARLISINAYRSLQPGREERDEAAGDGSVIVTPRPFTRGDQLHDVSTRHRIGNGTEHKLHAPDQIFLGHVRQRGHQRVFVANGHYGVLALQDLFDLFGRRGECAG